MSAKLADAHGSDGTLLKIPLCYAECRIMPNPNTTVWPGGL